MTQASQIPALQDISSPIAAPPAVALCIQIFTKVFDEEMEKCNHRGIARYNAAKAYRNAMPLLFGYESIRDFIACTAPGLLIGAIEGSQSSKLLYAAQVALATVRRQPAPQNPGPA
jgi:hypothetical protein